MLPFGSAVLHSSRPYMSALQLVFIRKHNPLPVSAEYYQEHNCTKVWPTGRVTGWHFLWELTLSSWEKFWTFHLPSSSHFFVCTEALETQAIIAVCFRSPSSYFQIPHNLIYLAQCSLRVLEPPTWLFVGKMSCNSILHH